MAYILSIETSTLNCSVSLAENGKEISSTSFQSDKYSHAEKLSPLIEECLAQANLKFKDLNAIAVCKGPGSYTGLRIGVSTAKGLCYGLGIPLVAMDSTEVLSQLAFEKYPEAEHCVSLLDARRMEVYSAQFSRSNGKLGPTEAIIIDESSFSELGATKVVFIGDAASKCEAVLSNSNWKFDQCYPSAAAMNGEIFAKFEAGNFEDVAYFEPYYLKDFVAGKPKDILGQG